MVNGVMNRDACEECDIWVTQQCYTALKVASLSMPFLKPQNTYSFSISIIDVCFVKHDLHLKGSSSSCIHPLVKVRR